MIKNLTKKYLINLLIILLVTSAFYPIVIGNDTVNIIKNNNLDKLIFIYSNNYGPPKLSYYEKYFPIDYSDEIIESQNIQKSEISSSEVITGGPMNSAWPIKCHDTRHTGQSPYSTADNPYDEKWKFSTDGWIEDSPTIDSDGTIYFGGSYNLQPWYLFAVNTNGTEKWKFKTNYLIMGSSPAIAEDGTIYIGSWDGGLYAINPNGTQKWRFGSGAQVASSPAIAEDGTIYFGIMGPGDLGRIYAINPNGTEKWHYDTEWYIVSDPAIGNDGTVYIGSLDSYLYALYPNGTLRWRFKTGDRIYGSPSIADDGTIYIGSSWDGYLYALYPNGTLKWKYDGAGTPNNPSIGSDGTIYAGYLHNLVALNPDGSLKWSFYIGDNRFIGKSASAISADGTIYFGIHLGTPGNSDGGEIIAVNPNGTEKWRKYIADEWVESSPCIGEDGTIYIGSSSTYGALYSFGIGELEADADGPYYGLVNDAVRFTGSAYSGYRPYTFFWDFGDTFTSYEQNPQHAYIEPGNYSVILTVTDNNSNTVVDTTFAWIQESNTAPNTPGIDGPARGIVGVSYPYTFVTTDPDASIVWYYIDWDDSSNSGWLGPYDSGAAVTQSHTWSEKGSYTIQVKTKDPYDAESDWGSLDVTIPRSRAVFNSLFFRFLERLTVLRNLFNFLY